jgi:hypothetical protein
LLAEPELKGILRPFAPADDKALAIVSTEDLETLYELLAERGITFQDQLDE